MPAPTNDDFASAINLDLTGSLPASLTGQTNFDATKEATEPAFGTNDQSVWYRIQPTVTGWYKFWIETDITAHNGRGLDLTLGSPTTLAGFTSSAVETRVANPDSFIPTGFWTVAGLLTSGNTYYLKVFSPKPSTTNAQTADFTLHWDAVDVPANNDFANAETLSLPDSVAIDTYDCTFDSGEPIFHSYTGSTAQQSRWYKFTATADTYYLAKLLLDDFAHTGNHLHGEVGGIEQHPGTLYLQVFNASVDTLAEATDANELASNLIYEQATNDISIQFKTTTAGTYYMRAITPYILKALSNGIPNCFNDAVAATTMELSAIPQPANDDFADAEVVTTTPITGTTYGATEEAGEEPFSSTDQSVWFEWSPPSDGNYLFSVNKPTDIVGHSVFAGGDNYEVYWAVYDAAVVTTPALATYDNMFPEGYTYTVVEPGGSDDGYLYVEGMLAASTYMIKVSSRFTSTFNQRTADFQIHWELILPPDNDDFADAEPISGASGSVTGEDLGSSFEVGAEPRSYYWNNDDQEAGTVWYDWTCPTTGDYVFKVQCNEPGNAQAVGPIPDLAVWQGSTLASLTKITRNWAGSQNTTGVRDNNATTAVGFHGTSGQHYKIQVSGAGGHELVWRTNTVTGDSTAAAASFPDGRIDNYGNDDSEPPPNFATILASHDSYWFTTGGVGHVKWYKRVITETEAVEIRGKQFDESEYSTNVMNVGDIGMICYKGANYASLVVADESGTSADAAMMITSVADYPLEGRAVFVNIAGDRDYMLVDCDPGDTLWIAVFGLYENGEAWSDGTPEDATQFEADVHIPIPVPPNDIWDEVWDDYGNTVHLSKDALSGNSFVWPQAGKREGTTIGATAEGWETARAGFAPTNSVWYTWEPYWNEDPHEWEFSVDSAVDCVMGIYTVTNGSGVLGPLIASDDDSGPGDTPLITITPIDDIGEDIYYGIAIVIDSKTPGAFTLKYRRVSTATPPANDDFDDAVLVTSIPFSVSGTTVGATAEYDEHTGEELNEGPKDTVWYKYVATFDGSVKIKATDVSDNDDAYVYIDTWHGTTLAGLERHPDPPPTGPGGGINRGFFNWGDTAAELDASSVQLDVVNGETYYIRVQTESGGSEDFTLHVDLTELYLNLQASGSEEMHGTLLDDAEVYLNLSHTGVEDFHAVIAEDSATVYFNLQSSGSDFMALQYSDAATVYLDLYGFEPHECFFHFEPSWTFGGERKWRYDDTQTHSRWLVAGTRHWTWLEGEGLPQEC